VKEDVLTSETLIQHRDQAQILKIGGGLLIKDYLVNRKGLLPIFVPGKRLELSLPLLETGS
jgi:hypothetical protein